MFFRKHLTTYTMSTNPKMVAIQGESGSHSEVAAQELLGFDVSLDYCDSIAATVESVLEKTATCALLPLENTTAGIIQPVWDHFLRMPSGQQTMVATKEIRHRVSFVGAARKGADLKKRRILAHPVAQAQCGAFLSRGKWEVVACHDTAGAARLVSKKRKYASHAALCPEAAANHYGLEIFDHHCGDEKDTWTRFVLLELRTLEPLPDDNHAILLVTLSHTPGALAVVLGKLADNEVNLSSVHSRAVPGQPGKYHIFMEVECGASDPRLVRSFDALPPSLSTQFYKLGSYKADSWDR